MSSRCWKSRNAEGGLLDLMQFTVIVGMCLRFSWRRERRQIFDGKAAILRAPTGVFGQFGIDSRHGRERSAPLMLLTTSRQT